MGQELEGVGGWIKLEETPLKKVNKLLFGAGGNRFSQSSSPTSLQMYKTFGNYFTSTVNP